MDGDDDDLMELNEENLVSLRQKFAEEIEHLQASIAESNTGTNTNDSALAREIYLATSQSKELLYDLDKMIDAYREALDKSRALTSDEVRSLRYFGFRVEERDMPNRRTVNSGGSRSASRGKSQTKSPSPQYPQQQQQQYYYNVASEDDDAAVVAAAASARMMAPSPPQPASIIHTTTYQNSNNNNNNIEVEVQRRVEEARREMNKEMEAKMATALSGYIERALGDRLKDQTESVVEGRVQQRVDEIMKGELSGALAAKVNKEVQERCEEARAQIRREYDAKYVTWQKQNSQAVHRLRELEEALESQRHEYAQQLEDEKRKMERELRECEAARVATELENERLRKVLHENQDKHNASQADQRQIKELCTTLEQMRARQSQSHTVSLEMRREWLSFVEGEVLRENADLREQLEGAAADAHAAREHTNFELHALLGEVNALKTKSNDDAHDQGDRSVVEDAQRRVSEALSALDALDQPVVYTSSEPGDALDEAVTHTLTQLSLPFPVEIRKLGSGGAYKIDKRVQLRLVNGEVMVKRSNGYETLVRYLLQLYNPLLMLTGAQQPQDAYEASRSPVRYDAAVSSSPQPLLSLRDVVTNNTTTGALADIRELQIQHQQLQMELDEQQKRLSQSRQASQPRNKRLSSPQQTRIRPAMSSTPIKSPPPPTAEEPSEAAFQHTSLLHHTSSASSSTTFQRASRFGEISDDYKRRLQERQKAQLRQLLNDKDDDDDDDDHDGVADGMMPSRGRAVASKQSTPNTTAPSSSTQALAQSRSGSAPATASAVRRSIATTASQKQAALLRQVRDLRR
eukprot:PhM_4_TR694/c0_g1_i1/m.97499